MFELPLKPGDRVIAAFPFRDKVLVITEGGQVLEIRVDDDPWTNEVRLVIQSS